EDGPRVPALGISLCGMEAPLLDVLHFRRIQGLRVAWRTFHQVDRIPGRRRAYPRYLPAESLMRRGIGPGMFTEEVVEVVSIGGVDIQQDQAASDADQPEQTRRRGGEPEAVPAGDPRERPPCRIVHFLFWN